MPELETLEDIRKNYRHFESMPVRFINRFLCLLYKNGEINEELCVSKPMKVKELEDFLSNKIKCSRKNSENICQEIKSICDKTKNKQDTSEIKRIKVGEEDEVSFNYDDSRLDQARYDLHELWSSYENEREKEISFLTFRIKKIRVLLIKLFRF
ncbi:hypothetical protein CDIK_3602, partial [Cucumispora dikerogammari]